jgi:trimeric autotransporter adhesin
MQENAANTTTAAATNNMTEWGVALLYATLTNGSQNNTIQGCTISLNRTYLNTCGIYSNTRHSAILVTAVAEVTSAAGANSNNKIYSNTISNVNLGIALIGAGTTLAAIDTGNDIGGTSATTGNTLTNWGGGATPTLYTSLITVGAGIFTNQQINDNVSYNTVTSASGLATTTVQMIGIIKSYSVAVPAATTVTTSTMNNNTVSVSNAPTTAQITGISFQSATGTSAASTVSINNNTITGNISGTAATSAVFIGILGTAAPGTLNINSNTISGVTTSSTTGGFIGIQQQTNAVVNVLNINNNKIGDATNGAITFNTTANTGAVTGISVTSTGAAATCALSITGNDFRGITHTLVGSGANTYIINASATLSQNISSNTFTNLNINSTGSVTFIANSVTVPANGTQTVSNNSIVTAFNKAGAGGTITLATSSTSSVAGAIINHANNNFSNITVTGATIIAGWVSTDGGTANKNYTGNTFSNWTGGTGTITGMNVSFGGGNGGSGNVLSNNTITNITGQSTITGISLGSSGTTHTATGNTITGLVSTGTGGAVTGITSAAPTGHIFGNTISALSTSGAFSVNGIVVSAATECNVYKNKIYNLEASLATGTANGLSITGGSVVTAYNNIIGDIRTPNANAADPLRGISITGGTTINAYNNTVNLSGTSAGALFGSSGISVSTTPIVTLINNLVVNNCVATGAGVIAAHRRSTATLTTYGATSNNNSFYAPTIYTDGTTPITTLAAYKGVMTPRDLYSYSENPTFVSTVGANAGFLHIPASTTLTPLESGGATIALVTQDFDGDARPGPAGSVNGGGTLPDVGADEFDGAPSTPSIRLVTPTPATTTQCAATARVITTSITPNTGTTASATLTYSFNGAAPTSVPMTNSSGNTWTGTIPAATPTNATVTWGISTTNTTPYTSIYLGSPYTDDPLNGVTAASTASLTTVCAGSPTSLRLALTRNGTATLGAGASTVTTTAASFLPGGWGGAKTQYIIKASELAAQGLSAGNITAIGFEPTTAGQTYRGFFVNIGHTTQSAMTTAFINTGLTEVYAGDLTDNGFLPVANTVNTLTFGTGGSVSAFAWDGTSNIVVSISWSSVPAATTSVASSMKVDATGFTSSAYDQTDSATPAAEKATTTADGTGTSRPKFIFTGNNAPTPSSYTWNNGTTNVGTTNPFIASPNVTTTYTGTGIVVGGCSVTANVIVTASPLPTAPTATNSSQCGTTVPTAAVASAAGAAGVGTFKWYAAATGGVALQSSTSTTYTTAIGIATTFYVSELGTNGCESARTPVIVTISAAPALTITAGATVCSNDIFAITPTSTLANFNSYTWSPIANLFTDAAATTPYTTGSFSTIYLKSSTAGANVVNCNSSNSATGCSNTASVTVNVLPTTIAATAATTTPLCVSGSTSVSIAAIPTGATVQWQSSPNNSTWTDMAGATTASVSTGTITATTYYRASINKTAGVNCIYSNVLTVTVNNPSVGTRVNATRCGVGTATLSVTGNNGSVNWYANATGGAALAGGVNTTTFTTPSISATTTYYVDAQLAGAATSGGARVAPAAVLGTTPSTYGLVFDATTDFTLNSVDVFLNTATAGNLVIELQSSTGAMLQTVTLAVPAGDATTPVKYTANLGWLVPTGTNYRLMAISGTGMVRESALGGFPYSLGTSGTVTSGYISGVSTTYYYFYNWNTTGVCAAPRLAVTATVTAPPALTVSSSAVSSCSGAASSAVNVTSTVANFDSYTWSPSTGVTGTTSATFNPATTTNYTLTASNVATGCANVATVAVSVGDNPVPMKVTPATRTVCIGLPTTLAASAPSPSGSGTIGTGALTTNTASTPYRGFYGGSKTQYLYTAAELTAMGMKAGSAISSVSFNVLAHTGPYTFNDHTVAMKLTTSTALTTTLETGTTTVIPAAALILTGTAPFASKEILTTSFAWDGTSNLLVETCFNNNDGGGVSANSATIASTSTGTNAYTTYYSADNTATVCSAPGVATTSTTRPDITFEFSSPATYAWSPTTNLFTDAAGTIPYTGTNAATVYAKLTTNQVYTATARNSAGCTATATSTLTANAANMAVATGSWLTGATWSCGVSPIAQSNVTIPTGITVLLDASNTVVNDLTFTGGGKLRLDANTFTVNGVLTGDATAGYVVTDGTGKLRQAIAAGATKTFPIGGSTTTYSPVTATPTTATTFGASVSNTINPTHTIAPTAASLVGSREWDFSSSVPSATALALTPDDGRSTPTGAVKMAQWNGTKWVDVAATFAAGTWSGTTSAFLPTILTDANVVIPVEFQNISAKAKGSINVIDWSTASEKDVKEFAIERSVNNKTWTVIGTEKATGGAAPATYSFNDNAPTALAYYRIRSIETSGKEQVSKVVAVKRDGGKLVLIMVSPMPTTEGVNVDFAVGKSGKVNLIVTDIVGRIVKTETFTTIEGANTVRLDLSQLAQGTYIMSINDGESNATQRIVKQ